MTSAFRLEFGHFDLRTNTTPFEKLQSCNILLKVYILRLNVPRILAQMKWILET